MMPKKKRLACLCCVLLAIVAVAALWLWPEAHLGLLALCNKVFDMSEAVNAYAYDHFAVPEGQSIATAVWMLAFAAAAVTALCVLTHFRPAALIAAVAFALGQAYFGLTAPGWINMLAFTAAAICLAPGIRLRTAAVLIAGALLITAGTAVLRPGTDEALEAVSERARDRLSQLSTGASAQAATVDEPMAATRHVYPLSLVEEAAEPDPAFHLVTIDEQQIARPQWLDWLRIILLTLAALALIILPFAPFIWLNRRRRQAAAARLAFDDPDVSTAVQAMFHHVSACLAASGYDGGNRLYRAWEPQLEGLSETYRTAYAEGALLFEEAAYSAHPLTESSREAMRGLLHDTEQLCLEAADWKQRFKLRYLWCLCE